MSTQPNSKKRLTEISCMNILFCLLVIWIHVNSEPIGALDRTGILWNVLFFLWKGSAFVVQGFIFLSAFKLFLKDKPMQYGKFYLGRIKQIILPYILCAAVYYLYFVIDKYFSYPLSLAAFGKKLLIGNLISPFYFVIIISQFYLLMPLWKWLMRKIRPVWLIGISTVITVVCYLYLPKMLALVGIENFKYNDRVFTTYLIYWILGALCGKHYHSLRDQLQKKKGVIFSATILVAGANLTFAYLNARGIFSLPQLNLLHMLYCIAMIFLTLTLFYRVKTLSPFASLLDKSSYYIFLWHCMFIYLSDLCFRFILPNNIPPRFVLRTLITYTFTLALCMGYQYLKEKRFKS